MSPTRIAEEKVKQVLAQNPDKWYGSGDIVAMIQDEDRNVSKVHIFLAVSNLARKTPIILRRQAEGTKQYEYAHNPNPPEVKLKGTYKQRSPYLRPPGDNTGPVHWKEEEKEALAKECIRLKEDVPYISTSEMLRKMQEILPANRRRLYIKKMVDVNWLPSLIEKIKADKPAEDAGVQFDDQPAVHSEESPPKPYDIFEHINEREEALKAEQSETQTYAEELIQAVESQSDPAKQPQGLESFGLDALLSEAVGRLAGPLKSLIINVLSDPDVKDVLALRTDVHIHHHHHHHGVVVSEEQKKSSVGETHDVLERRAEARPPRCKVGVVGNRASGISEELSKEFPHLRFVVTDRSHGEAADAVKSCDKIAVLTKFISHSTDGCIRKVAGERYMPVNGGMAELKRVLQILINKGDLPKE